MYDWLNTNQGAVMVILTLVYVIATVLLLVSNRGLKQQANKTQQQNVRIQLFDKRYAVFRALKFIISIISEYDGTVDSIDKMISAITLKDPSTRQSYSKAIDKLINTIDECKDEKLEKQGSTIQIVKLEQLDIKLTLIEIFKNEFETITSGVYLFNLFILEKMIAINVIIGKLGELMLAKYISERDDKDFASDLIEYTEVSKVIKEAKDTIYPYIIEKLSLDDMEV